MKLVSRLGLVLALLVLSHGARATQNSLVAGNFPTVSPYPGLTLVQNINTAMTVVSSNNAGASAPSYAIADMFWPDTTANLLKFTPNGTNWYPLGAFGSSTWTAASDGVLDDAITSTGSSNAYVVTYSPAATALVTGHVYKFVTNFGNTASATVNFNSLGAITLKKQGGTNLASGDLGSGAFVSCAYDGTNCQITSQLSSSGSAGVSSIATTSPVCGGTITSTGTLSICSQANNTVMANISGSSASPSATAVPVATSWGVSATSGASGNVLHSPSTNALALATAGTDAVTVYSDQGIATVGATGGDQGSGTVNTTGLYVNGVSVTNGSGLTLLHTQTCTSGSPCSTVTFNNSYFTSTYNRYLIKINNLYTSDGQNIVMQISSNNGGAWYSSYVTSAAQCGTPAANIGNIIGLTASTTNPFSSASIEMTGMATSGSPSILWEGAGTTGSATYSVGTGAASTCATASYNAAKLYDFNGGTMVGSFSIYGYAN